MNDLDLLMLMPHIKVVEAQGYFIVYDLAARKLFQPAEQESVLLTRFIKKSIAAIKAAEEAGAAGLMQALHTLIRDQIVFCIAEEELNQYPEMDPTYVSPSWIETVEMDIGKASAQWFPKIRDLVFQLQPSTLLFQVSIAPDSSFLSFLKELPTGTIYIKMEGPPLENEILQQILRIPRVFGVWQGQHLLILENGNVLARPFQVPKFIVNGTLFRQAMQYHTYFYKRLFIAENGALKNARELPFVAGHIKDYQSKVQLLNWVQSEGFTQYWTLRKDDCEECRNCCFRYACIDNRGPLDNKSADNLYTFATECSYKK